MLSVEDVYAYTEFWSRLPALVIDLVLHVAISAAVFFTTLALLISAWAVSQVDATALEGLSPARQSELVTAAIPVWIRWPFLTCQCVWGIGDLVVFIQSYERRAWHDLIAGTVVVYKIPHVVGTIDHTPTISSTSLYR